MSDITIVFLIILGAVILFVQNRLPVVIVALAVPFSLYMSNVLSLQEVFSGFGDPRIIFISSLFVVSAGLEAAGVTDWVGQKLIQWSGTDSRARLLTFMILIVAILTAMISVNGAVAALLPVVIVMAIRTGTKTSQLLMPLAFGAHCGSMLAWTLPLPARWSAGSWPAGMLFRTCTAFVWWLQASTISMPPVWRRSTCCGRWRSSATAVCTLVR